VSLPREFREETSTSAVVDVAELDVFYHNLPSYQPEPTGDSRMAEEMMLRNQSHSLLSRLVR